MTLNIGMFGAGRIGIVHARSIAGNNRSKLVAVTDLVPQAAHSLASEYDAAPMSADEILADSNIDAIVIASSTNTHVDLIEAGINAGKAVFCEKPVDLDLSRAKACLDIVAGQDRPVMIGFNRRFDPNFTTLKSAFDAGEVGKGELLSITSFDPAPPPLDYVKVSGGLFCDMAIHDFDMACWLFDAVPETVNATGACLIDPEIGKAGDIDTAVITLRFDDGRIATIRNSRRAAYGYDQRLELLGERGLLSAGNVLENTVIKSTLDGINSAKPEYFFLERYMRSYGIGWASFVDAVLDGKAIPVSVSDGVNALAIAEAAGLSLAQGRAVELDPILKGVV
ncbi:Myo-inositol 2-dehydrogenase 1 [hydrothermal vent metagenome]|uniref:Myo-inositol 2-dehydrogenase 1 n=1 Tax=hydrothermal vent metagenome TaxID=652676 RepID=A0A3B0U6Q8_9ZZZZ